MKLTARDLERIFDESFLASYRTRLEGGGGEPLCIPSPESEPAPHRIVYRADYFASALHEVAHWCLAGSRRRQREDYGYWYAADGRDAIAQVAFERVEAKPQAIEWIFSEACGFEFNLSADNLASGLGPTPGFDTAVRRERAGYLEHGLPARAEVFLAALSRATRSAPPRSPCPSSRTPSARAAVPSPGRCGKPIGSPGAR
jgi:elongation factor P hydroxylase